VSSSLKTLHPEVRRRMEWALSVAQDVGLRPRVTSTRRSLAAQRRLYSRFLTGKADFPVAPPGTSLHERGLAIDVVSLDPALFATIVAHVGGRWAGPRDWVHYDF